MNRVEREKITVDAMINIYCSARHGTRDSLCRECGGLKEYALERLGMCVFGNGKPVCRNCSVHCYRQEMRERIRKVMRYSGPRMLLCHPVLAARHIFKF